MSKKVVLISAGVVIVVIGISVGCYFAFFNDSEGNDDKKKDP